MKILFACVDDSEDQNVWSGLVYYMRKTLEQHFEVVLCDKIPFECTVALRIYHQFYKRFSKKIHHLQIEPAILKKAAKRIEKKFHKHACDAIFCPGTGTPVNTFIDSKIPVFSYLDASKLTWIRTYFGIHSLCKRSQKILLYINKAGLENDTVTFFSSGWAKLEALKEVALNEEKLVVVPFGANLSAVPPRKQVSEYIDARDNRNIKLLFVGKEWIRKGGDEAFEVVSHLRSIGVDAELHVVGCMPEIKIQAPEWLKSYGFIDRSVEGGLKQFQQILAQSHLLLFMSNAEAYGLALCEANAFGVPGIASYTGGIPAIIENNINGYLFHLPLQTSQIALTIKQLLESPEEYCGLATRSRTAFEERLNWQVAGKALAGIIKAQIGNK